MSFVVNKDMFGRFCRIPTDISGKMHVYKIVSRIESNGYCDVPLTSTSKQTLHNQIVPVLLVIHCGVDESKVQRVALSDCEIIPAADVALVQEWISVDDRLPEEKVNCIVHYKHAYCDNDDYWAIGICFYDGEKFQINSAYKVTHWMPLPERPKGE